LGQFNNAFLRRWPPKFDLLRKPKTRLLYQIFLFCLIGCLNTLLLCKNFFSKIQDGAHIQYGVFLASFSRSSGIHQKHFLEEQIPKKNKKTCCQKFNSKWLLYSRWRPKLNLLVKTTNYLFSKNNFRAVLVA
jgi:hypothetical protein